MKKIGSQLIYISLLITIFLWILSKNSISEISSYFLLSVNQLTALVGTVLFVWSMFLATRLDFLETLFGGLDKVYKIHKKVSEIGAVFILLHPLMLALNSIDIGFGYFLPTHKLMTINLGIYSFWVFAFAIVITLSVRRIKLPYHIWKQTHRFLNLAMILALLHIVTVESDISSFPPLGVWIYMLTGLGVASGLYMTFFYKHFGPSFKYRIVKIKRNNDVYDIYLEPTKNKLNHKIAQYVYVTYISELLSKESHPFCITSLPEDNFLRLSIKELGDYTAKIKNLKVGDLAIIYGPYGRLAEKFGRSDMDSVFIAGGIGIAPFLSMFKSARKMNNGRFVNLFYCTKYKNEATFEDELKNIAKDSILLNYCNQCSREKDGGHLSAKQIRSCVRNVTKTNVYICGPSKMMNEMEKSLINEGFLKENIILEDFEMI